MQIVNLKLELPHIPFVPDDIVRLPQPFLSRELRGHDATHCLLVQARAADSASDQIHLIAINNEYAPSVSSSSGTTTIP